MGLVRGVSGLVSGLLGGVLGLVNGLLRGVLGIVMAVVATVLLVVSAVLCVTILLLPLGIPLGALAMRMYGQAVQMIVPGSTGLEKALSRGGNALRDRGHGLRRRLAA